MSLDARIQRAGPGYVTVHRCRERDDNVVNIYDSTDGRAGTFFRVSTTSGCRGGPLRSAVANRMKIIKIYRSFTDDESRAIRATSLDVFFFFFIHATRAGYSIEENFFVRTARRFRTLNSTSDRLSIDV